MEEPFARLTTATALVGFTALGLASPRGAAAGAWVPEPGSGYHKLSLNYFESDEFFGGRPGFEKFTDLNLSYYGEVGLLSRLALFGSFPLKRLRQDDGGERTESYNVGDVDLGLRYQWLAEPFVLSSSVLFKLPYFYNEDGELPPGNGQEDLELRLLAGRSLGRFGYFGLEGGFRFRFDGPADEIRYFVEYGVPFGDHLYFRTKLDAIEGVGNASGSTSDNLATSPDFDLGKLEFTTGWNFGRTDSRWLGGRFGTELTYTRDIYGDNTLQGNTFSIGVTFVH